MMKVFSQRRVITNRSDIVDGTLHEDDPTVVNLRSQVNALTIGHAEIEMKHMNILSSMETENDRGLTLMKARIQATEELNYSLKISKESLIKKVADLELAAKVTQNSIDEEKSRTRSVEKLNSSLKLANNSLSEKVIELKLKVVHATRNSSQEESKFSVPLEMEDNAKLVQELEKLKSALTNNNEDNKAMENTIQDLHEKRARIKDKFGRRRSIGPCESRRSRSFERRCALSTPSNMPTDMKDKYCEEVKRNSLLEEQIQIIVTREDTTNKSLAKLTQDAEDSILQRNKKIDKLEEELDASKDNILKLVTKMQSIEKKNSDEIQSITFQFEEQKSELIILRKKLDEEKEEVKQLLARERDTITQLEQKNTLIERISIENETYLTSIQEKEASFQLIIQKHKAKLIELDEMREKLDAEIEHNAKKDKQDEENKNILKNASKHEELLRNQSSEIDTLTNKLTRIKGVEQENHKQNAILQKDALQQQEHLRNLGSEINELKKNIASANIAEHENLKENADLQKRALEHEGRLRDQGSEIDELKKKLTSANIAKSEIEVNLKERLQNIAKQEGSKVEENNSEREKLEIRLEEVEKEITVLKGQLKEKDEHIERRMAEIAQMYKLTKEQTAIKRDEILDLQGELLTKSHLLTTRNHELESIKYDVDKQKLCYESDLNALRQQVRVPGDRDNELEKLRARNSKLEYAIAESKQEIKLVRRKFTSRVGGSNGTVKVLRNRNESLKNDVETLLHKMKHIVKSNISEI